MLQCIQLLTVLSIAGTPAYYSPVQITDESKLFAQSAEYSAPKMQVHQREMRRINKSLMELSLNAELLGLTEASHWSQQERAQIKRGFYESNVFIDSIQNDYNTVYVDAMNRAITPFQSSHTLEECSISRVAQMAGKSAQCKGKNLTPEIIAAMDADSTLISALKEIESRPWPSLKSPEAQQSVIEITGTTSSINPSILAKSLFPEQLEAAQIRFEDAIAPIETAIDEGSEEAMAQAKAHRLSYEQEVFKLGTQMTAAVNIALAKSAKKDDIWNSIGYCVQPEAFGGCGTQDLTAEVSALIKANKKAMKALP